MSIQSVAAPQTHGSAIAGLSSQAGAPARSLRHIGTVFASLRAFLLPPEKFAAGPKGTPGKVFPISSRVNDANQPTRGIFDRFSLSPILHHTHLPKLAVSYGLVAGPDTHGSSEREMSCVTKDVSEAPKCL